MTTTEAPHRFNPEQQAAIDHPTSTVVLAGPGSGKTDTIVAKVTRLVQRDVAAPRGVACITYSTEAVREFTLRLRANGIRADQRLFLGTVHSFCLQRILRPFAHLYGRPDLIDPRVLTESERLQYRGDALRSAGADDDPRYFDHELTRIRRAIACEESLDSFDERHVDTAHAYNDMLIDGIAIDFEGMTLGALQLIELHPELRELIIARHPWIAIDEYQDLGGPLHRLVLALHDYGAEIFAVGDPDQCILGFTGAKPEYLEELSALPDFEKITLQFNYRAGAHLIAAAEASLGAARGYRPDPDRVDPGTIDITSIDGGLTAQARYVVRRLVPALLSTGIPPERIAILYKARGPVLDALATEMDTSSIDFLLERDLRFPNQPIARWLQLCAARAIAPENGEPIGDLAFHHPAYTHDDETVLDIRRRLLRALQPIDPDTDLVQWLEHIDSELGLTDALRADPAFADDLAVLRQLTGPATGAAALLSEFARGVEPTGRVVVTTCHSSKGRQFDVVVMPGLQRTLFPSTRWDRGTGTHRVTDLKGDRRLLYVGITRARHQVHLIHSPSFTNPYGYAVHGRSQFLDELEARLAVG